MSLLHSVEGLLVSQPLHHYEDHQPTSSQFRPCVLRQQEIVRGAGPPPAA